MTSPQQPQQITVEQALGQAQAHWNAGHADQAERLCQHVLALWPGQSDALHLMGLMAHAYGNLDLAIDHLRKACLAPRVPAAFLSNLAEMCRQKGLLEEAEQAARRAVTLENTLVAGWNNLGIILQEAGKLEESLHCLQRVAALQPGSPEAHNNLGNTLKRMGRLAEARRCYEAALALAPAYAEAFSNRANLLTELGVLDEALADARRAIDINPRLADAYINAGAAELAAGRYEQALRWADALANFAPLHVGAMVVKAKALSYLHRLDEALVEVRRAVASLPDNGEAQNALGEVLQARGNTAEALAAFERSALALGFAPEKALLNRASLLMELGERDKAEQAFDALLARFPRAAGAWFNFSDLHRFTAPDDPALAAMEALLAPDGVQVLSDRIALGFALAKAWMDLGEPERAFAYLDEANRSKRATFSYDSAATDQWTASIATAFSAEAMARPRAEVAGSEAALFVLGMPRSGTSLVEQILASHPQVFGAGELADIHHLTQCGLSYPAGASQLPLETEAALGRRYLESLRTRAGSHAYMVDKMPSNFFHAGFINRILPGARIIHVRRNPVDTCLSCYSKLFTREQLFAYDQTELGLFYRAYERLMAHWRVVLPADRFFEIEYEELVADLEGGVRRLLAFCGLAWSPACLDFHQTRRLVRTASVNQVRQPLFNSSVGRWKPYARQLGPLLAALGVEGVEGKPLEASRIG